MINYKARRGISIGLGLFSAAGTVLTAILVAKETPKAMEVISNLKKKENVSKKDYILALLPVYWKSGLMCLATMGSSIASNIISRKTEASLIATAAMANQGWMRYKGKVKDIFGIDADKLINTEISKEDLNDIKPKLDKGGSCLYWEEHLGFFRCQPLDLMAAVTDLNQRLHTPDPDPEGTFYFTTLYQFAMDAKADVLDKERLKGCKNIGWTTDYLCSAFDIKCMWVHPCYTSIVNRETGEIIYVKISFFEDPIILQASETSRYHYKSRADYEHEAECDLHDADAFALYSHGFQDMEDYDNAARIHDIQESFINSKIDCDMNDDDGRRFIPSNPENMMDIDYLDNNEVPPTEKE